MAGLKRYPGYSTESPPPFDNYMVGDSVTPILRRPTHLHIDQSNTITEGNGNDPVAEGTAPQRFKYELTPMPHFNIKFGIWTEQAFIRKHVGMSVGVASLIAENLLSHPFVVLRRQCQVHNSSKKRHIIPFTLLPAVVKLHQRQGVTTLWKGLGSTLLIRGMSLAVEDLISKVTPWPKEITWHRSMKTFGQHILLKCATYTIMTPFYSASLVETVQSDIASEKPGVFDVFKEGLTRLVSWGSPHKGRMLPVWALVIPTVVFGVAKYLLSMVVKNVAYRAIHLRNRNSQIRRGAVSKDILSQSVNEDIETTSTFIGVVVSEVVCYPFETILHRLHLQGTRTIVDNLDSGSSVIPILTNYASAFDCYKSTVSKEGVLGLYKGFGALILQFIAHWALIKLTKVIVAEISTLLRPMPKSKAAEMEIINQPPLSSLSSPSPNQYSVGYLNPAAYSSYPDITP